MASDTAKTKADIAKTKREIQKNEKDLAELAAMIADAESEYAKNPDPAWLSTKEEVGTMAQPVREELAANQKKLAALEASLPETEKPKWSKENHPAFKKVEAVQPEKPITYSVGDTVEAKWTDRQWYKAKISMIIGNAANPQYTVRFVDYKDESMTVDGTSIRPLYESKKRKAEAAPMTQAQSIANPTIAPVVKTPGVISAAPSLNPAALSGTKKESEEPVPQKKKRKTGNANELKKKQQSWRNFMAKGAGGKVSKKDSMFRTGDAPNARVGFTGSGAPMRKVAGREKFNTKIVHQDDDDTYG